MNDETIAANIVSAIVVIPILCGAFLITHFDVVLTQRESVGLWVLTMIWIILWNLPNVDQPKGNVSLMMWVLGVGALAAFGFAASMAYTENIELYWEWVVVFFACAVSWQQVGMRKDWNVRYAQ